MSEMCTRLDAIPFHILAKIVSELSLRDFFHFCFVSSHFLCMIDPYNLAFYLLQQKGDIYCLQMMEATYNDIRGKKGNNVMLKRVKEVTKHILFSIHGSSNVEAVWGDDLDDYILYHLDNVYKYERYEELECILCKDPRKVFYLWTLILSIGLLEARVEIVISWYDMISKMGNFQDVLSRVCSPLFGTFLIIVCKLNCFSSVSYFSQKLSRIAFELIEMNCFDVNIRDEYGFTALMYACKNGRDDIVWKLLDIKGIDIYLSVPNETILMWACERRNTYMGKIALRLLDICDIRNSVNVTTEDKRNVLFLACHSKMEDVLLKLLDIPNIDVNTTDVFGRSVLMNVCDGRMERVALKLLDIPNIDLNIRDIFGESVLESACSNNMDRVQKRVLELCDFL